MSYIFASDQEVQKIIETYSRIYKIFFGGGKFLVMFIGAIMITIALLQNANNATEQQRTSIVQQTEKRLTQKYEAMRQQEEQDTQLTLHIQQGPLSFSGDIIQSIDNYMTYRGFVLPQKITVNKNTPMQNKEYFSQETYDPQELAIYMNNFIYITQEQSATNTFSQQTLPLPANSLQEYFSLGCLDGLIVRDILCDQQIQDFLDTMYVYDLRNNHESLQNIFTQIHQKPQYTQKLCDSTLRYIQYTNDSNEILGPLMRQCGETYNKAFSAFALYRSVQDQIAGDGINSIVTNNKDINAYKLVSTQQEIFADIQNNQLNQTLLNSYIRYVEELQRKNTFIDQRYFDEMYVFNNSYLNKQLIKKFFSLKSDQNNNIKETLESLRALNNGNSLAGYDGLYTLLVNTSLHEKQGQTPQFTQTEKQSSLTYFQETYKYKQFIVEKVSETFSGSDTLRLQGYFRYDTAIDNEKNIPTQIKANILLQEIDGNFLVQTFDQEDSKINAFIQTTLAQKPLTIAGLHNHIRENWESIQNTGQQRTVCDTLAQNTQSIDIETCTDTNIVFKNRHPWKESTITYTFEHEQGNNIKLSTTDPEVTSHIISVFAPEQVNSVTFPTLLIQIHQYRTIDPYKQTINLGEKNNEKLQIQKVIQEFLQVDPDTILEKNGSFLVELTIDDIPLILAYDITTDTIGPLTFSDQPSIIFTNFSLSLNTENTRNISSFSQDVLQYLAEIDEDKVKEYSNITKR